MAAIVIRRERYAIVRPRSVSLVLFGGCVCARRSLHGRLVVMMRTLHAGRLAWVVHLITMMSERKVLCVAANVPSAD
jgi:hypothetical protein